MLTRKPWTFETRSRWAPWLIALTISITPWTIFAWLRHLLQLCPQ